METFAIFAIPALMTVFLVRMLLAPMKFLYKTVLYSAGGFLCLWLLNLVSGFTGVVLPINAVTVLIAAFGGVPGIGLIAILEVL